MGQYKNISNIITITDLALLFQYCQYFLKTFNKIVQIMCKDCKSILQISHRYYINNIEIKCKNFTNNIKMFLLDMINMEQI